jgi:hypothetical protein
MWNAKHYTRGALAALALAAGCAEDSASRDVTGPDATVSTAAAGPRIYDQVEFLGNPLVSEVTILKANHNTYNRTQPYNTATFRPQTEQFITGVAGRPAAYASTVAGVLYPDMLVVDTSKDPSTAGWLTWALGSPLLGGPPGWGGRRLSDDVVDIALIAAFSDAISPVGASCAPGALPLCTDNVPANDKAFLATFPYLAAPTL